jgi:hypothetical protein
VTGHALPSMTDIHGTWKFQVYTTADLTVPTIATILSVSTTRESANITLGTSEIGNVQINLRDDTSTYKQGFWFKALQGETWLRILLDEGAGDTFYFFGMVDAESPNSVSWDEFYLSATQRIRTANVALVSMARKIFDMDMDDWVAEILLQCTATEEAASVGVPSHVIKFKDLFACMISASGLNPDYSASDVSLVHGTAACITWGDGVSDLEADAIWVPVKYCSNPVGPIYTPTHYFNTAADGCLSIQSDGTGHYGAMDALLKDFLGNGCLQMRMDYDPATERHKIQLMHKKNVYTGTIHFDNREKTSSVSIASRLVGDSVRVIDLMNDANLFWISKKYARFGNSGVLEPDPRISFDVEYRLPFIVDPTATGEGNHSFISWNGVGNAIVYITGVKYLSTISGLMTETSIADPNKMSEAVGVHTYEAFITAKKCVVRKYGGMYADAGSGDTHTVLNIMRRTEISELDDDGSVITDVYYANTVTKDAGSDEVEVEWIEE